MTGVRSFNSILIANRGEIALRVMRSAKALGYRTIAVYSEADTGAPHVEAADDAVLIGPAPTGQSYLDAERVLKAAEASGAEAIHPGYGFLSENADFARACAAAGLVFIGPPGEAIDLMGNKAAAKRHMIAAGVPCIPGYEGVDQSDRAFVSAAEEIGLPLMVKAAAGGGGRGMRLVEDASRLLDALASARSEALNAFASDELILEKALLRPRHVEMQIFADAHGAVVHMGERDCSVQRRHQKVVEEAPCPVMNSDLRSRMGAAAVEAARSIDYCGAGTVEFLLDEAGDFYFLEMNTRLQVEHPVTEMITGLDLVALQIQVADGRPLGLAQEDIRLDGHAIEARLYAEDVAQDFLPSASRIERWAAATGAGVRFDSGIRSGQDISPFYDPMIAKAVAWGETREVARHRLIEALKQTTVFGLTTNRRFLIGVLASGAFAAGAATTAFIAEQFDAAQLSDPKPGLTEAALAAVLMFRSERREAFELSLGVAEQLLDWSSGGTLTTHYAYDDIELTITPEGGGRYGIWFGDERREVEVLALDANGGNARLCVDERRYAVQFFVSGRGLIDLALDGTTFRFRNENAFADVSEARGDGSRILAPMHGTLLEVLVRSGERVEPGQRVAVLEAMKMQHDIVAEMGGIVQAIHGQAGAQTAADQLLIEIETDES